MKKIYKDKIVNIENTDLFDNKFLFEVTCTSCTSLNSKDVQVVQVAELLEKRKNMEILKKVKDKPAMYSNVYSPEDELEIFRDLFDDAIKNNKKIHIIWITLKEEIELLEEYYEKLWFLREDINCFDVDFSVPLVTASVNIENLMWKWSDYKRMRDKIFFNPPIRESGQVKWMFKWINRWVTAWININNFWEAEENFLKQCMNEEKILPITLARVLKYNLDEVWLKWENNDLVFEY